eukprot:gene5397-5411_t
MPLSLTQIVQAPPATAQPDYGGPAFRPGIRVLIQGLTSSAGLSLNGQIGVVEAWDVSVGRHHVRIDGRPVPVRVLPENLEQVDTRTNHSPSRAGFGTSPSYPNGSRVQVHGLTTVLGMQLNGLCGIIEGWDEPAGRHIVRIDGRPEPVRILIENLDLSAGASAQPVVGVVETQQQPEQQLRETRPGTANAQAIPRITQDISSLTPSARPGSAAARPPPRCSSQLDEERPGSPEASEQRPATAAAGPADGKRKKKKKNIF